MACTSMINVTIHPHHEVFATNFKNALVAKEWKHGPEDKITSLDGRVIGIDIPNLSHLTRITTAISGVQDVISVRRVNHD